MAVQEATDEYLAAEDTFAAWLEECTEPAAEWAFETSADLFASWKTWADQAGEQAMTRKSFAEILQSRGFPSKRKAGGHRGFNGIRLRRQNYSDDGRSDA